MIKATSLAKLCGVLAGGICALALAAAPAGAQSLREAVAIALESNPQIGQAIENREATQFELRQAQGLFLPRVDLEASAGARRLDTPSRRLIGLGSQTLAPFDVSMVVTQRLFDGFEARSEVERQAARVDGAAFRVLERSEFIALQIAREYFDFMLQARIVDLARQNVATHERILSEIREAERQGTLTAADTEQAQERVFANRARMIEAQEELEAARTRFQTLVGVPLERPAPPPDLRGAVPGTLEQALGLARGANPRALAAQADVGAADAVKRGAQAPMLPQVFLEGRARAGRDLEGAAGRTTDLQGRVVLRMNLFDGGVASASQQEQIRRASEERLRLHQVHREIEEAVRLSWDRRRFQRSILSELQSQLSFSDRIVASYAEQFQVGRRSLLDVLDAYNTRYNVQVLNETARLAIAFAEYRILAAAGRLVATLDLRHPPQAEASARAALGVAPPPAGALDARLPLPPLNPFR